MSPGPASLPFRSRLLDVPISEWWLASLGLFGALGSPLLSVWLLTRWIALIASVRESDGWPPLWFWRAAPTSRSSVSGCPWSFRE